MLISYKERNLNCRYEEVMGTELSRKGKRILLVLEADLDLFHSRISRRSEDVVLVYSRERKREHFAEIFENKFKDATISELAELPEEIVQLFYQFYDSADDLLWYLRHTEDLPLTLQQNFDISRHSLKRIYFDIKLLCQKYREPNKLQIIAA